MAQKSVKKSRKAEHCMLKALANGLLGHPFPERVAKRPVGWLRARPSLFFSVPVPLVSSFAPALPLYCLMLNLFDPIVWPPIVQWSHGAMFHVNPLLRLGLFLSLFVCFGEQSWEGGPV